MYKKIRGRHITNTYQLPVWKAVRVQITDYMNAVGTHGMIHQGHYNTGIHRIFMVCLSLMVRL